MTQDDSSAAKNDSSAAFDDSLWLVVRPGEMHEIQLIDLGQERSQKIRGHGSLITSVALDSRGEIVVTGSLDGTVRVGWSRDQEPHQLPGHKGQVSAVSISPDGRWIASGGGNEIRLWPMPDLSKPPLHTVPHEELVAKLARLTNLEVVEDETSATGYRLDVGPFPGWADVPTW